MSTTELVYALAIVTLGLFLAWSAWQMFRPRQATRTHEHAALSDRPDAKPSAPSGKTTNRKR